MRNVVIALFAVLALSGGGTAIALAADNDAPPHQPLPLEQVLASIRNGVTAHVTVSGMLSGSGQVWWSGDGRGKAELQAGMSSVQAVWDTSTVSVYVAALSTVYRANLPPDATVTDLAALTRIDQFISGLETHWTVSPPLSTIVPGRAAYSVTLTPKASGSPLSSIEVAITNVVYGAVAPADLQATFPAGATTVNLGSLA